MLRGWRNRQRRQGFLPAPPVSDGTGTSVVGLTPGLFVGTTFAGRWLDRVAVHGLSDRAIAELSVQTDGVHIDREGTGELFLPYDVIDDAGLGDALAGKVMGPGGLLVLTWRLGAAQLTSAFRADDHAQHQRLADAIRAHLPVAA
ncbi:MAG: transporter [Actinobacteria bacterium]|nr:transporter [Actinomycetota bacterium]